MRAAAGAARAFVSSAFRRSQSYPQYRMASSAAPGANANKASHLVAEAFRLPAVPAALSTELAAASSATLDADGWQRLLTAISEHLGTIGAYKVRLERALTLLHPLSVQLSGVPLSSAGVRAALGGVAAHLSLLPAAPSSEVSEASAQLLVERMQGMAELCGDIAAAVQGPNPLYAVDASKRRNVTVADLPPPLAAQHYSLVFAVEARVRAPLPEYQKAIPAHTAYLKSLGAKVLPLAHGPALTDEGKPAGAGLHFVQADSLQDAIALVEKDPLAAVATMTLRPYAMNLKADH
jgi:uncharacterized protein YciI